MKSINRKWFVFLVACLMLALLDAVYLTYHHYLVNIMQPESGTFCSVNQFVNCDAVAESDYSLCFGIPVSSIGIFAYLFLLIFISTALIVRRDSLNEFLAFTYPILILMLGFSLYELFASIFIVKAFCIMCAILYVSVVLMIIFCKLAIRKTHRQIAKICYKFVFPVFPLKKKKINFYILTLAFIFSLITAVFLDYCCKDYFACKVEEQNAYSAKHDMGTSLIFNERGRLFEQFNSLEQHSIDLTNTPFKGFSDAPITIVEFSDFQCPACASQGKFLLRLLDIFPNKVKIFYKFFPLDHHCNPQVTTPFHILACEAAKYAYCAYKQNKFWELHDLLYQNIRNMTPRFLKTVVQKIGFNTKKFNQCLEKEALSEIMKDIKSANQLGLQATPTIFVNGRQISNIVNNPYDLKELIRMILEQ